MIWNRFLISWLSIQIDILIQVFETDIQWNELQRIMEEESFWIKRSNKINIEKYIMNELFEWMKDIIALTIQMKNQVAQSFLNMIICERWRKKNQNQLWAQSQKEIRYPKEHWLIQNWSFEEWCWRIIKLK